METGIKDNRKSLPDPVPRVAAVLEGSWLRGFRAKGPEPSCARSSSKDHSQSSLAAHNRFSGECTTRDATQAGVQIWENAFDGRSLTSGISERTLQLSSQEEGALCWVEG